MLSLCSDLHKNDRVYVAYDKNLCIKVIYDGEG